MTLLPCKILSDLGPNGYTEKKIVTKTKYWMLDFPDPTTTKWHFELTLFVLLLLLLDDADKYSASNTSNRAK